jgi:hypothetical protein
MKKAKVLVKLAAILALSICVITLNFLVINAQRLAIQDGDNCSIEIEGFKLCAESTHIEAKTNQDIKVQLLLLNSSEKKKLTGRPSFYEYKAVNESGESLETVFDKEAREKGYLTDGQGKKGWRRKLRGGSSSRTFIDAQASQKEEVNLSKTYDFTAPGKYIVSIKRNLPSVDGNGFVELILDKIEIEIKDEIN